MRSTTIHLLLPAVLLTLVLSACGGAGGGPAPTGSALPTESATPEPTPTETGSGGGGEPDPSTLAASVLVATNYVLVTAADDSQLANFTMYESTATAVAALTTALGGTPVISHRAGGLETAPATVYDFSGLAVVDSDGLTIMNTDFHIEITTDAFGDVPIYTYFDLQVGDPMSDALAVSTSPTGFAEYTYVGEIPIDPVSVGESPEWDLAIQVGIEGTGGSISRIVAPTPNWGV